ncbi:MAG: SDR family oxidoreductase [Acidimicrobiales bacterium]
MLTGAARAIGAVTAKVLTRRGHEVVATARDPAALSGVDAAQRLALDVRDTGSIHAALNQAGNLDAIVNNAAINTMGPLEDLAIGRVAEIFDTNCLGALRVVQAVVPHWRERRSGIIVNVSSIQGRVATPLEGAYGASKYALEAISETLHYELAHFGIRTVIIEPGYTDPGMKPSPRHPGPAVYAALWEQWDGVDERVTGPGGRSAPELVADAIADAIENPETPLRVPVGEDADFVFSLRQQMGDAEFEATMRASLGLSW